MGITADLFVSKNAERETLHRRITPTNDQQEDQQERWNDLASFLKSRLKEDTGLNTRTWLQGSYKFGTQIRPWSTEAEFDIDLGLYFEWSGDADNGGYSPKDLKEYVQQALVDYQADDGNDSTGVEDPKERCCRIAFNPDFHIDVPCYHLDADRDARSLATETKGWEESDPKAIYQWFKDCHDEPDRAKVRRQVRYMKMWAALNFEEGERPSSILLTVLVAEALAGYNFAEADDDDILEHVAAEIHTRISDDDEVLNPKNGHEDLNRLNGDATENLLNRLEDLHNIARRARDAQDKDAAAEIWSEAFGQFFPMPEDNDEEVANAKGEQNALAVYRFDPEIEVIAVAKENEHHRWQGLNELPRIPKQCDITFRLRNAYQLPEGASLRWTVRNRGSEALHLNDLGHTAGTGTERTETSAYNGDHAMDLTVYLGTQVIGRRRIWVKIRGMAIPPRNKPRRRYFG